MDADSLSKEILSTISTKSVWKRDVFELTKKKFAELKAVLKAEVEGWATEMKEIDERLEIIYRDTGSYYAQATVAGDILIFTMHTNVFRFPEDSIYRRSSYIKDDPNRAFCGVISVYNFLADSFRFNRDEDTGYLLARIFVNRENHFVMEGKKELNALFSDFQQQQFTAEHMRMVILAIVRNSLQFDLYMPHYASVQEISVRSATELKDAISLKTGKRLGYQFNSEFDAE